MPDPVADYLRSLNTSDRARAAAWDAAYAADDADAQRRLGVLPFSPDVKAAIWDLRQGGTLTGTPQTPTPATAEQFMDPAPAAPQGSATSRFVSGAAEMLNPIAMAQGAYQAVRHPIDTAGAILSQQGEQLRKGADAFQQGRYTEAAGHGAAGLMPLIGPAAAESGEQIAAGDIAGGLGKGAGLLAPLAAADAVRGVRAVSSPAAREATAAWLDSGAHARVEDVIAPKVGANKVRFGNQAERVAPHLARDMTADGAPLTREGLHGQVGARLQQAEEGLDAAADQRLAARTFQTQPLIDGLLERRKALTAEAVDANRPLPQYTGSAVRGARSPNEFNVRPDTPRADTGMRPEDVPLPQRGYRTLQDGAFASEPSRSGVPIGHDVVPGPNAARVAVIDQAISELRQLGPVTRYEPIRRIRQAYDGPAKAVYNPSMTADYLKAQGSKLGAADVTGALRDHLAQWDPQTAAANAEYSVYRSANDVLQATAETERTRPRVGRAIIARLTGTILGQQAAGAGGAVAGYIGGPLVDSALASGFTTKLKTARLMTKLADAIRGGDMDRVTGLSTLIQRELRTVGAAQTSREVDQQASGSAVPIATPPVP
jgi:hypothetical protein